MNKLRKWGGRIIAVAVILLCCGTVKAGATQGLLPYACNNLTNYLIKTSSLAATSDGYVRVFSSGGTIYAEDYNDSFQVTNRRKIPLELSNYGGFFNGSDAYYLVFGQNNTAEDNNAEVIRVVKDSKSWTRLGAASLRGDDRFGCQIRYPFDYGNVSMAEESGKLYLVTGHEGYVDPAYNQGHQGFLMFVIDEATMTGTLTDADLWHSFSQHIAAKDPEHIYVLEEREGSRFTKLSRLNNGYRETSIATLRYGGERTSAWAIPTHASADAIAVSEDHVLAVGTSIDQSKYADSVGSSIYNIYLTVTPMDNFTEEATSFTWLTHYTSETRFRSVNLTKVSANRFMLSWETYAGEASIAASDEYDALSQHVLHYLYLNGSGQVVSQEYTAAAALSDCVPVVKNGQVVYYASDGGTLSFYSVNASNGAMQKKKYQMAGENAQWSYSGGVLTITGTGRIYDDFSSNSLERISDGVQRIVLGKGITEIGEASLSGFDALTRVDIPKGVTKIGNRAFAYNQALQSVNLPKSVVSLGEGIFETGWYWGNNEPVIYASIVCEKGSQAEKYAALHKIDCTIVSVALKDKSCDHTGKPISIGQAAVTGRTGKMQYLYYTDQACTKLTTSAKGAAAKGGPPSAPGTYYVRATIKADSVFGDTVSKAARLEIRQKAKSGKKLPVPVLSKAENVNGGVKITWKRVSGAPKYRVLYKTGNSGWRKLTDTVSTSFTWMKAKSGTRYSFTVCCLNQNGKAASDYNKTGKSITYIAAPKLTKIQNIKSGVKLTWQKSPGAVKYRVLRKTKSGKWVSAGITKKLTFVDKKAKPGVTYWYTVRCVSANGKSNTSGWNQKGMMVKRQ